jgi:hypothetical protein
MFELNYMSKKTDAAVHGAMKLVDKIRKNGPQQISVAEFAKELGTGAPNRALMQLFVKVKNGTSRGPNMGGITWDIDIEAIHQLKKELLEAKEENEKNNKLETQLEHMYANHTNKK